MTCSSEDEKFGNFKSYQAQRKAKKKRAASELEPQDYREMIGRITRDTQNQIMAKRKQHKS